MNNLIISCILASIVLTATLPPSQVYFDISQTNRNSHTNNDTQTIDEFFDNDLNIYCLIIGGGIILLSALLSLVLYKVRSRSAQFAGSLFQNIEDDP